MKNKLVAVTIFLMLLLSIFSMVTMPIRATEWDVYPGQSIQEAINAASPGDTIIVHAGTYNEALSIYKPLEIIGDSADTTIIDGTGLTLSSAGLVKITANSGNVRFSGFSVRNVPAVGANLVRIGILTRSNIAGPTYTITDNKIYGTNNPDEMEDYGFYASYGKENVVFKRNLITQTGANNIVVEQHEGAIEISHNTLDAGCWGIDSIFFMAYSGLVVTALQNVSYNTFDMGTGVQFDYGATGVSFCSPAPDIGSLPSGKYTNMLISGNTFNNLQSNRRGIGFWNAEPDYNLVSPSITDNVVNGVPGSTGSFGIDFYGNTTDATITHNTISGVDKAIALRNGRALNTKINYNNIAGNAMGLDWILGPDTVDARFNWWGDASGPTHSSNPSGIGDKISDNVDYSPWLGDTFETTPRTYHVNPTGTIQEAIDEASPGDTITVHAGTYDEQVVINKALTLTGEGDATIIKPSGHGTFTHFYTLPTQADAGWNGKKLASIISVENVGTAGVTISKLKVDGILVGGTSAPAGANWLVGILYGESAGTVENVRILNMDTPTASPPNAFNSYGIFLDAVITTVSVEVSGCTIVHYNRNGIMTRGAKLTVDINANVITGPGAIGPTSVPNGIVISYGTAGTIRYNRIFNNYYEGTTYLSFGIMGWNEKPGLIIEHNEVYDTDVGIGPTSGILIRYNDVHDCKIGIELELGAADNNIEYNQIHDNYYGIRLLGPGDPWGGYTGPGDEPGLGNTASYNNIFSNTEGVRNWDTTQIFDSRYNWWGNATGPYHPEFNPSGKGDKVSNYVNFEPWLLELYPPPIPVETLLYIDPAKVEYWTPSYNGVFKVDINIANVTDLTCYEFKLYWNTTLLDFDYAYIVEIWPLQIKIEDINEAMGRYWLAVSAQGEQSFTGSATLVELYFKLKYDPIYPNNVYSLLDLNETVLGDTSEPTPQPIPHMVHDGEYWCYSTKPKMKVEPSLSTAKKLGQTFSVNITVHDVIRMYDFEFWFYYDTTLLDIYSPYVQLGPMMSGATIYISGWDDVLGYVHFAAKLTSPSPSVNGSGTIAIVTFKVTKASIWPDPDLECTLILDSTKLKTIGGIEVPHDKINGLYRYKPIIGDLNTDGTVDLDDFYIIALAFGSKPGDSNWNKYADLDRNGVVNVLDLRTAARHFGEDC